MPADVHVRVATAADIDALIALFVEVADERLWIGTEPGFDREAKRRQLESVVSGENGASFVASVGDGIVGQIGVHRHQANGLHIGMMVKPGYRGRGIGTALVWAATRWAKAQGEPTLSLLVFPHNAAAIALYERCGFHQAGRREAYIRRANGEWWDAIAMTLDLSTCREGLH